MRYQDKKLIDQLAAEYALGTLKGSARQRFESLQAEDLQVHDDAEQWSLRVNKLAQYSPPVAPPAIVWDRLEEQIFGHEKSLRWYEKIGLWQALTLGSSGLAAVFAALLFISPLQPDPAQQTNYVVVLQDKEQQPVWTLSTSTAMDQLLVRNMKPMPMPSDRGCQLWVQPEGSDRIYPLGLLPDDGGELTLDIAGQMKSLLANGKLIVTVEDTGKPALQPTAPAEFTGRLVPIKSI